MGNSGPDAPVRLGRYELLTRLAHGGMGEIFLARLEGAAGFEKLLVVKRILPHLADDERFRAMLIAEARIASVMAHASICQVYELGETDGQLYIVMEYLEGIELMALLRKAAKEGRPLELGLVAGVVQQCTEALHYAHELRGKGDAPLGIVHRDVTPGNIFLTEAGVVKLLDFGIAKVKDAGQTQAGTVKGKRSYMAPEQLRGAPAIDRRADVFALGVVLYEMLALRRLFQRKTAALTYRAVMEQPIPDLRTYRPDAPAALVELLGRALERDPDRRPATARELGAGVLDAIGAGQRPWSQADLADFLRAHFADEISRRRTAAAVELDAERDRDSDSGNGGFPTVELDVPELPPEEVVEEVVEEAPRGPSPSPSFEDDVSGEQAAPRGQAVDVPPPTVVVPRRGLLWPLLGIAMIGITATALALVWRQVQQPDPIAAATPEAAPAPAPAPAPPPAPAVTPAKPADPYAAVINAHRPQLNACVSDHPLPAGGPKVDVKVKVVVGTSGTPRAVSFEPGTLDGTAAGACIKRTLSAASFPGAREERTVTFRIWI